MHVLDIQMYPSVVRFVPQKTSAQCAVSLVTPGASLRFEKCKA